MSRFWKALEAIRGLSAARAEWQRELGNEVEAFQTNFLRRTSALSESYPCPHECGCYHKAVRHAGGRIVAVCQCDPWNCDDIALSEADLEVYELNWLRLGRAIAAAFDCDFKLVEMGIPGAFQTATFSGTAMPIILMIRTEASDFRNALAVLVAKLHRPFALLSPTGRWMDAEGHTLLATCKAGFFDLESHLTVSANGALKAVKSGGELFSRLLSGVESPLEKSEAARVFGLIKNLRASPRDRKAPPAMVFDLVVLQDLPQKDAALKCRPPCSEGTISKRVTEIEKLFGLTIEQLKNLRSDIREIESSVKGDRRRRKRFGGGFHSDSPAEDRETGDAGEGGSEYSENEED